MDLTVKHQLRPVFVLILVLILVGVVAIGSANGQPFRTPQADNIPSSIPTQNPEEVDIGPELKDEAGGLNFGVQGTQRGNDTVEVIVKLKGINESDLDLLEQIGGRYERTRMITLLKDHASITQEPLLNFIKSRNGIEVKNTYWITNAILLSVDTDQVSLETLARIDGVKFLQKKHEFKPAETITTGAGQGTQFQLNNQESDGPFQTTPGIKKINATKVWSKYNTMGEGVKVAVIDPTGINESHPDIDLYTENESDPTYPGGWAEFTSSGDRIFSEPHATGDHGTAAAGIVAGGNHSGEYIGVAPKSSLMFSTGSTIDGIQWAVQNNASVIVLEVAADYAFSPVYIDAIGKAEQMNTAVITTPGNTGQGTPSSPGNVYDSISTGSIRGQNQVPPYSGGGVVNTQVDWGDSAPSDWPSEYIVPDVVAPTGSKTAANQSANGYEKLSGTSAAVPHVGGAVTLIQSATDKYIEPHQMKEALRDTAWKPTDWVPKGRPDTRYGKGIIDVLAATDYLSDEPFFETRITDVTANISESSVEVTTKITNHGTTQDTQTVDLEINGVGVVDNKSLTLGGNETQTITLVGDWGSESVPGEVTVRTNDNRDSKLIQPYLNVDIIKTNAPINTTETLQVTTEITNYGESTTTQNISLNMEGFGSTGTVDTRQLTLEGGETKTIDLEWQTGTKSGGDEWTANVSSENNYDRRQEIVVNGPQGPVFQLEAVIFGESKIAEGEVKEVPSIRVGNAGDEAGTLSTQLHIEGVGIVDTQESTLGVGESDTFTLQWDTTGYSGEFEATIRTENGSSFSYDLEVIDSVFDVEVLNVSPIKSDIGDTIKVNSSITNVGGAGISEDINLSINGITIGTQNYPDVDSKSVTLDPNETRNITLEWSPNKQDLGGIFSAEVSSEDRTDGMAFAVYPKFDVNITKIEPVESGGEVNVTANISNTGFIKDTQNITLKTNNIVVDSENINLEVGESKKVNLSWQTGTNDAGRHNLTVSSKYDSQSKPVFVGTYFDVSIVNITDPVYDDEKIHIKTQIENKGTEGTQQIKLEYNGKLIAGQSISLESGESTEVDTSYIIPRTAGPEYNTARIVSENDSAKTEVEVCNADSSFFTCPSLWDADQALYNISIVNTNDPLYDGQQLNITAKIKNKVSVESTQVAELVFDGSTVSRKWVSIDGQSGKNVTLSFNLPDSAGPKMYNASVVISDNSSTTEVEVCDAEAPFFPCPESVTVD